MKETWLFLDSGYCSPAYNMACDEALLNWQKAGDLPPVIRFYGWNPATLSIGYFQKAEKEINLTALARHELGFVRRPTGGRAVLHEHELTYSVIVPETHPKMPKTVTEAYRVISEGVKQGFIELGLHAYFSVPDTEEQENLKKPQSAVCFDSSSWYELVVEGRKVAGSAQTRQAGIILQHGAILLDIKEDKLFDLFNFADESIRQKAQKNFHNKAVTINQLLGRKTTMNEAVTAFKSGFEKGLNLNLEPLTLTAFQKNEINDLAKKRYLKNEWNYLR